MATGDLCTLADVRLAMETKSTDTELDNLITALIPQATRAIIDVCQRELAPASTTTRRIDVSSYHVDLCPYDLRAATTVTLDPDANATVLVAHVDYELLPIGGDKDGMFTRIRLSKFLSLWTEKMFAFGHADLAITGDWGYLTPPQPVKDACVVAVRSWLRRDLATYAQIDAAGAQPQPTGTYSLPKAALSKIAPYMRYPAGDGF